jgi:hypothetical protein
MDPKQFDTVITNLINLEAHMPEMSPFAAPARDPAQDPSALLPDLEALRRRAMDRLARLKPGSSGYKIAGGYVSGLTDAIARVKREGGQAT